MKPACARTECLFMIIIFRYFFIFFSVLLIHIILLTNDRMSNYFVKKFGRLCLLVKITENFEDRFLLRNIIHSH